MANKCANQFIATFLRVYFGNSDSRALFREWRQGNQTDIIKGIISHGLGFTISSGLTRNGVCR